MGAGRAYALAARALRVRAVDRLTARRPRVGLDGVLQDLDRTAQRCAVPGEAVGEGFTWEEADRHDRSWWPQGVASLRSGEVLLVSWYAKRRWLVRTQGARVSVVDRSDPERPRYRHVLLVAPRRLPGPLGLGTVGVHAGGIAVHGDHLLVADTLFGLRVFRLADLVRLPGRPRLGYSYVLPQLTAFRVPLRAGLRRLRHSFVSVGEADGGPVLVVGEYRRKGKGSPRLARYPLDGSTGLPAVDGRGRCVPSEVHRGQPARMQGAAVHGATWFVSASAGEENPGDLYVGTPGAWQHHRRVLPIGPEDLAWSRPGEELWCVSEHPGRRWVFSVPVQRWLSRSDAAPARAR